MWPNGFECDSVFLAKSGLSRTSTPSMSWISKFLVPVLRLLFWIQDVCDDFRDGNEGFKDPGRQGRRPSLKIFDELKWPANSTLRTTRRCKISAWMSHFWTWKVFIGSMKRRQNSILMEWFLTSELGKSLVQLLSFFLLLGEAKYKLRNVPIEFMLKITLYSPQVPLPYRLQFVNCVHLQPRGILLEVNIGWQQLIFYLLDESINLARWSRSCHRIAHWSFHNWCCQVKIFKRFFKLVHRCCYLF